MFYLNSFQCCGYVTKDPILETVSGSIPRLKFTVALNRPGARGPFYIDCVAWEALALSIEGKCRKGTGIFISGEIETSTFKDERGSWHKATVLKIEKFSVLKEASQGKEGVTTAVLRPPKPRLTE